MKNKASLVLLEQLIMTLVFALAAAICLQIFVIAKATQGQIIDSHRSLRRSHP